MTVPRLLPGDVLLYSRGGFFNRVIRFKTWSRVSHVEVVATPGEEPGVVPMVCASRNGVGVGFYEFTADGLYCVLRPRKPFDARAAWSWFRTVKGQKYDWLGLLAFTSAKLQGKDNGRMFCSEFAARYLRAGGFEPFTKDTDADAVAPSDFLKSGAFEAVDEEEALFV